MDFVAGCIGGTAGCLATHPLDTIKVRLQCQPKGTYAGLVDCCSQILKKESVRGLYKGLTPPLCTVSLVNAVLFGTFGYALKRFEDPSSIKAHFLAGAGTGLIMSPLVCPVELIKCKMQMQGINVGQQGKAPPWLGLIAYRQKPTYTFTGPLHCLSTVYKREGYAGTNRGMLAAILRRSPGLGLYFATNEALQQCYKSNMNVSWCPVWYLFLAGGISGCVPWAVFYPVDVIKSRIQCDGVYCPTRKRFKYKYSGYVDCIQRSVRAEGYGLFYRGLSSTFLRTFPNNGIILTVVALVRTACNSNAYVENEQLS